MYHTLAWTESIATGALNDLAAVSESIYPIVNNHFMPPVDVDLFAAVVYATDIQRAVLTTPRLRQISPTLIRPLQPTLIGANDANIAMFDRIPVRLRGQEEITLEALQDNAGAQRVTAVAFVGEALRQPPPGDVIVIRGTSTTAAVANAWSQLTYTLDQSLPAGRYVVVCVEHISANGQAVRMVFDGQFNRPGAPSLSDVNQRLPYPWLQYRFGMLGSFVTYSLPRVEVLCNGADASHELYFHIIPTG